MEKSKDPKSALPRVSDSTIDSENQQRGNIRNFFATEKTFEGTKQDAFEFFASVTSTSVALVKEVVGKLLNERQIVIQTQTLFDAERKTSSETTIFTPQDQVKVVSHPTKRMFKPQTTENHIGDPRRRFVSLDEADSFLQDTEETQSVRETFRELFGLPKNPQKLCNDPLKCIQELLAGYSDREMDTLELLKQVRKGR